MALLSMPPLRCEPSGTSERRRKRTESWRRERVMSI